MSIALPNPTETAPTAAAAAGRRPWPRQLMHVVRRAHLYLGLFLLPWAILYGVTSFLFNHPAAFSDQPTTSFGPAAVAGTPLDSAPSPDEQAAQVVTRLNEAQKPAAPYAVAGAAKYAGREFAFATVKADGRTLNVLLDVRSGAGTVRAGPVGPRAEPEKAPFAVGSPGPAGAPGKGGGRGKGGPPGGAPGNGGGRPAAAEGIKIENPLPDRVKAAVPTILARTGFPAGDVTVTSVPDVVFPVAADGRVWTATYSPLTGAVSGTPADAAPPSDLSWRRFLLRLHTAHGYPGEPGARWFWAVVVDAMAFVMVFWGVSGLAMWWQLTGTRRAGLVVLVLSALAATALGVAMHAAMSS